MESISLVTIALYYLSGDPSLYYLTGSGAVGMWYGQGAATLGYLDAVIADQLKRAFAGLSPDGSRSLVQVQAGKERQPAWDLTFSVPKSLSVLWSRLDAAHRKPIEEIVLRAVQRTLDYLDAEALMTRRGSQGGRVEHARGVYALFLHRISRALDPQLHVHAVAMNLCLRSDSTTGTIRSRDLYWHKMAAGALFRAELAYLLATEHGLTIVPDGWKFKIAGVPGSLCDEFSKRTKHIEQLARVNGWRSPEVLAKLAVTSRQTKQKVSLAECLAKWGEVADKHGFTREAALALLAQGDDKLLGYARAARLAVSQLDSSSKLPQTPARVADGTSSSLADAVKSQSHEKSEHHESQLIEAFLQSVDALASFKSHFPERDLVRETATRALACGASASEILATVKQGVRRFENRIEIQDSNYTSYSTKENIAAEKELLERAYQGVESTRHIVPQANVLQAIARCERELSRQLGIPTTLTTDQQQAVRYVTQEPGDLKIAKGYAGAGKTQMLQAAQAAWKSSGYHVLGTAVTGRAALGLEKSTRIPSVTIEYLLRRLRPEITWEEVAKLMAWHSKSAFNSLYYEGIRAGKWMRNPLLQAGREASAGLTNKLTDTTKAEKRPDCRLTDKTILVVDEAAMLPTRLLLALQQECHHAGAKLVLVGDALQLPPIEAGAPFESLAARVGHCSLTTIVRQKQPWMQEATSLLIANEPLQALERYAANGKLHMAAHQRGAIEKLIADYGNLPEHKFPKAIALTATNAEARLINQGVQAKRKATKQLGGYAVSLPNGERVHTGDRIMLTLNDYRLNVRNGLLATVIGVEFPRGLVGTPSLRIRLDDHQEQGLFFPKLRTLTIDLKTYPNVQLGYAATTHKVQGITMESSFVLIGDVMLSKERAFTQLTRASHDSTIYAAEARYGDALQLLTQQIGKQTAKDLAHDHTVVRQPQSHQGLRRESTERVLPSQCSTDVVRAALPAAVKRPEDRIAAQGRRGPLRSNDLSSTGAIFAEAAEAARINHGIQQIRQASGQLGADSLRLPNRERVFSGDRVLISTINQLGITRRVLGTVVGVQVGQWRGTKASITVELDHSDRRNPQTTARESIVIAARDLTQVQLGYATSSKNAMSLDGSFYAVLPPVGQRTPETVLSLLNKASSNFSLYGVQACYGSQLDAGQKQGMVAARLHGPVAESHHKESVSLDSRPNMVAEYQRLIAQQTQQQRSNDGQRTLSWEQSFTL
jgi:conjugative relaxase-like TrwC/TraI family protein